MSQASKRKVELILSPEEVGGFLQKLGQELDQGALVIGNTRIDVQGFKSLGLSIKDEGDGEQQSLRVKLKVKFPKTEAPVEVEESPEADRDADQYLKDYEEELLQPEPEDEFSSLVTRPRPKYKSLKKRMKGQFKAIKDATDRGELPGKALVSAFAKDSELMITYPDEGEEYYKPYEAALQKFLIAHAEGNQDAVARAVEDLDKVKVDCHEKYK